MTISTYTCTADEHVLDKSGYLTISSSAVSAIIKDDTNMINPTLIVSNSIGNDFNYVYISEFNRYYYVRDIVHSQQRYYIELEVDPLYSFKSEIDELTVIANRSSSYYNTYQDDNTIPFLANRHVATQPFPAGFTGNSWILAVCGGDFT